MQNEVFPEVNKLKLVRCQHLYHNYRRTTFIRRFIHSRIFAIDFFPAHALPTKLHLHLFDLILHDIGCGVHIYCASAARGNS